MNIEQLSTQIVAINDAIQILARNGTSVQQHSKEIDSILKTQNKNDERIRDIENLIHQSCELKSREIQEQKENIHNTIDKAMERGTSFTKYVAAAISGIGLILFGWMYNTVSTQATDHAAFEATQDEKADKIFNEIFGVMREIRTDIGSMRSELAVIKNDQKHYQNQLASHMVEEENKWKGKH